MDIRFINSKGEIINASRLSIKVIGDCLIGINEKQDTVVIERYKDEAEAREILKEIRNEIWNNSRDIVMSVAFGDILKEKGERE